MSTKTAKCFAYGMILMLTSMEKLVSAAAVTSLNLVSGNVNTGSSSPNPSGHSDWQQCGSNGNNGSNSWSFGKDNDQDQLLYDGDNLLDSNHCICGKQQESCSGSGCPNDVDQSFTIAFTSSITVKTIITTHTPYHSANFDIEYKTSGSSSWNSLCSSCVAGSNDFAGSSDTNQVTLSQIKLTFLAGSYFGICEVWAYSYKNYAPLSTTTFQHDSTMTSESYDKNNTPSLKYLQTGKMIGVKHDQNVYSNSGGSHTCNYVVNSGSSNSAIVVTLPYFMVIKEIYHQGMEEVAYYLGDPVDPAINSSTSTATTINTMIETTKQGKYTTYTPWKQIARTTQSNLFSAICDEVECTDFATNKIIITNKEQYNPFFLCGFAIMAQIVPCPPTSTQCSHSQLGSISATPATINVSVGGTSTTSSFSFLDALTTQCAASFSQTGCTGKTFSLNCYKCSSCSVSATCSGTCPVMSAATFGNSFTASGNSATLTVTPTNALDAGSYSCQISCSLGTQPPKSSASFSISICPACSVTALTTTSTAQTAFTPSSFPTKVSIGSTGATSIFTAPTNSATLCSGVACGDLIYVTNCRNQAVGGAFSIPNTWNAVVNSANALTPTLRVYGSAVSLHGIKWDCQLTATHTISLTTATSNTFTVQFDMCTSASESCPAPDPTTLWPLPLVQNIYWIAPLDMIVYPDNIAVSNTLDYTKWKDTFNNKCLSNFCGTPNYSFVDSSTLGPLPFAADVIIVDNGSGTVTFTVKTVNVALAGIYYVTIKATLQNDVVWTGTRPSGTFSQFMVSIIDPCGPPPLCKYTKMLAQTTGQQLSMSITLNGAIALQSFLIFNDFVSSFCNYVCNPIAKGYFLINAVTGVALPSDLSGIQLFDTLNMQVYAGTTNFAYTGTYQVYIQAVVNLQYYGGTGTSSVNGNTFTLTVDACASCAQTTLLALGASDTQPTSYSIGVENTPGSTLFSPFKNIAANYCLNPIRCGSPTYALVCVIGCTAGSAPPFSTSIAPDASGKLIQTSWTTDVTLAGIYTVKVIATLDRSTFGQNSPSVISTNNYVITVDACNPLPCQYNSILTPLITGPFLNINHLPQTQVVLCNGTVTSDYFTAYTDTVSTRCSGSTYHDMCGAKQYTIEQSPSGTALPFGATVAQSGTNTDKLLSFSTSDCAQVNFYNTQIHASFVTPTTTVSDNIQVQFLISVEWPDPCLPLICASNTLSAFDALKDTVPVDFSIWVNNTWGSTNFSNFRDIKSDKCDGKPGGYLNGTLVTAWQAPVCGYPTYEVYLAATGTLLSSVFGGSNVQIVLQGTLFWQLLVRTTNTAFDGQHQIYIVATMLGAILQSPTFILTVLDQCNPYNCSLTAFYPEILGIKPQNITVMVGQGFVPSNQALWTDSISKQCSNAVIGPLCGITQFVLLQSNGIAVPFSYKVTVNEIYTQVAISVTDPTQAGEVYYVYLQGFQLDQSGLPFGIGSSNVFSVTIIESNATDYGSLTQKTYPTFDTFPSDQTFLTNTTYETVTLSGTVSEINGTIVSISAQLGSASSFVTFKNSTGQISFQIVPTASIPLGDYVIKVTAIDSEGAYITNSFKISIQSPINITSETAQTKQDLKKEMQSVVDQMKSQNSTDHTPITAVIESISINGLMVIKFSAAVVTVKDIQRLSNDEIFISLEQNSFEEDQTLSFKWTVIKSTPFKLFVQLMFAAPLDISQGSSPDRVKVWLQRDTLMIKDTISLYKAWVDHDSNNSTTTQNAISFIDSKYLEPSVFCDLVKNIPYQVLDVPAGIFLMSQNLSKVKFIAQSMFWGPFFLQVAAPQAMEKTWLIFSSLQMVNIMSQFKLKIPTNVENLAIILEKSANSQFFDNSQLYGWLRKAASDKNQSQPVAQNKTNSTGRLLNATNSREEVTTSKFENSKYFGHGSTEKVLECGAQLFVSLFLLGGVFLIGIFIKNTFLHWLPNRLKEAFHSIKHRFFYSLPLRILSQQYMQVTLGAFINLKLNMDFNGSEQSTNAAIAIIIIACYSLLFPIWMIFFLRKNKHRVLTDQIFVKQWNTLFLNVDLRQFNALFFLAVNLIRRFLLIFVAVEFSFPLLQIILVMYIQTIFTVYILKVQPMDESISNYTLIFNELVITFLCINLFIFTDYVPSALVRYQLGWIFLYFVYLVVLVTAGVWIFDFYQMIKRQYMILKFKHLMEQRKIKVIQHNTLVDIIGKHNPRNRNVVYKRRNLLIDEQLLSIESLGNQENDSESGRSQLKIDATQQPVQTIALRKQEFQLQMVEMKKNNDFDEDVVVKKLLNNTNQEDELRKKRELLSSQFDDIFRDLLPEPVSQTKLLQQVQKDYDWPISPRHAHIMKAAEQPQVEKERRQEQWSWDDGVQGSNASHWNAMPSDFSKMESSHDSSRPAVDLYKPKNHVGKITQLATIQQQEEDQQNENLWISMDYDNRSDTSSVDFKQAPVFHKHKKIRLQKLDPLSE